MPAEFTKHSLIIQNLLGEHASGLPWYRGATLARACTSGAQASQQFRPPPLRWKSSIRPWIILSSFTKSSAQRARWRFWVLEILQMRKDLGEYDRLVRKLHDDRDFMCTQSRVSQGQRLLNLLELVEKLPFLSWRNLLYCATGIYRRN